MCLYYYQYLGLVGNIVLVLSTCVMWLIYAEVKIESDCAEILFTEDNLATVGF